MFQFFGSLDSIFLFFVFLNFDIFKFLNFYLINFTNIQILQTFNVSIKIRCSRIIFLYFCIFNLYIFWLFNRQISYIKIFQIIVILNHWLSTLETLNYYKRKLFYTSTCVEVFNGLADYFLHHNFRSIFIYMNVTL